MILGQVRQQHFSESKQSHVAVILQSYYLGVGCPQTSHNEALEMPEDLLDMPGIPPSQPARVRLSAHVILQQKTFLQLKIQQI